MSNLSIHRGDDRTFVTAVTDDVGNPADITGALEANFTVKRSPADDTAVISKGLGTGVEIPVPFSGIIETTLTPADTLELHGPYVFELELVDALNLRTTVDYGYLTVMHDLNSAAVEDTLLREGDYDAIRYVLGVTTFDVTDVQIDMLPFAPRVDRMIKSSVTNWQDQIAVPEQLELLRTAAVYGTAAAIAETASKGGFIGLLERTTRTSEQWHTYAEWLWGQYGMWVGLAEGGEAVPVSPLYDLPMVRLAGPTRAGLMGARWMYPPLWGIDLPASRS